MGAVTRAIASYREEVDSAACSSSSECIAEKRHLDITEETPRQLSKRIKSLSPKENKNGIYPNSFNYR